MRSAVLFGAAGQMRSPHALFHRCKLTAGLDNRGHVKLVFKVSCRHVECLGHSCHYVSFLQVPGQRFLTDYSLYFGTAFDRLGYAAHNIDADRIRGKDANYVNSGTKIGNVLEYPGSAHTIPACALGKGFCTLGGTNSG
jgi:hypothetical protein